MTKFIIVIYAAGGDNACTEHELICAEVRKYQSSSTMPRNNTPKQPVKKAESAKNRVKTAPV